jgi:single-stranded-DNA-specific exonuclease
LRDGVWGQGFAAPVFDGEFAVTEQRVVGSKHLRLALARAEAPGSARLAAILFNRTELLPAKIRAAYRPDANEWNGSVSLQLVIEHWHEAR